MASIFASTTEFKTGVRNAKQPISVAKPSVNIIGVVPTVRNVKVLESANMAGFDLHVCNVVDFLLWLGVCGGVRRCEQRVMDGHSQSQRKIFLS